MSHTTGDLSRANAWDKNAEPTTSPLGQPGPQDTTSVAKDQAAQVGQEAKASGQHVAGVAKDQASNVAGEIGNQAKDLVDQSRRQVGEQAKNGQQRAASSLTSLADELRDLADGKGSNGMAANLAHQASQRVSSVATWLSDREPTDVLAEVQDFARRRPATFLALAAGAGILAGRLTRGLSAVASNDTAPHASSPTTQRPAPTPTTGFVTPEVYPGTPEDLTGMASPRLGDTLGQPGRRTAL